MKGLVLYAGASIMVGKVSASSMVPAGKGDRPRPWAELSQRGL